MFVLVIDRGSVTGVKKVVAVFAVTSVQSSTANIVTSFLSPKKIRHKTAISWLL